MGMYMYPIVIKREPQPVQYCKEIELPDDQLTLAELRKHVSEDETFWISSVDVGPFAYKKMLYVYGKRLETPEELAHRIEKQEGYMERYNNYHRNKTK